MMHVINTNFGNGNLVLLGGIQLNMPYPCKDHFMPLMFKMLAKNRPEVNLLDGLSMELRKPSKLSSSSCLPFVEHFSQPMRHASKEILVRSTSPTCNKSDDKMLRLIYEAYEDIRTKMVQIITTNIGDGNLGAPWWHPVEHAVSLQRPFHAAHVQDVGKKQAGSQLA